MAANVPVKHEKRNIRHIESEHLNVVLSWNHRWLIPESWISYNPENCECNTLLMPTVKAAKGDDFVALNRISVSQPVGLLSSVQGKHPPLLLSPSSPKSA